MWLLLILLTVSGPHARTIEVTKAFPTALECERAEAVATGSLPILGALLRPGDRSAEAQVLPCERAEWGTA